MKFLILPDRDVSFSRWMGKPALISPILQGRYVRFLRWIDIGPKPDPNWIEIGSKPDQNWIEIGSRSDRNRIGKRIEIGSEIGSKLLRGVT